jgi:predicted nucleic acid-binding protein
MIILADTNVLSRIAQPGHPLHQVALDALDYLKHAGDELCIFPQNLVEFWAVATRPLVSNGLDMTPAEAEAELVRIKKMFRLIPDNSAIHARWEGLVIQHAVRGRNAHDARIVATMIVHGLGSILTFNGSDFKRYPGITVLDPNDAAHGTVPRVP